MKVVGKTIKVQTIELELSIEEATWLKKMVENPLSICNLCAKQKSFEKESDKDEKIRTELYNNLNDRIWDLESN